MSATPFDAGIALADTTVRADTPADPVDLAGGPPSSRVLERFSRALELDAAGREVLFLLAPAAMTPQPRQGVA